MGGQLGLRGKLRVSSYYNNNKERKGQWVEGSSTYSPFMYNLSKEALRFIHAVNSSAYNSITH